MEFHGGEKRSGTLRSPRIEVQRAAAPNQGAS